MTQVAIRLFALLGSAFFVEYAFAQVAMSQTDISAWPGVLAQVPIAGAVGYCFMKFMEFTRERETALLARERERDQLALEREKIHAAQSEKMRDALSDLASAIEVLSTTCARGQNSIASRGIG